MLPFCGLTGTFYKLQQQLSQQYGPLCRLPIYDMDKKNLIFALQISDPVEAKRLLNINPAKVSSCHFWSMFRRRMVSKYFWKSCQNASWFFSPFLVAHISQHRPAFWSWRADKRQSGRVGVPAEGDCARVLVGCSQTQLWLHKDLRSRPGRCHQEARNQRAAL